ncbi:MAG: 1,4-alpha-glucan branching enzyme [Hydrogenophilaceae bacterium CG1_02_62_390]|nr:1,4-alpha-glucan branching protein GlgB [Betaproteobacteria bacterium]OIO77516.1 MAG: 1,4-alpha-glucan branching enzyme [Hydrogenophilaceae bacterium CG1_02_62_390]PIW72306.1 MAG: 1,4-alpha-glucan branching enzyme [Hydrogenophilales bacterium CG12_big_fil_rev_8_21_14_0_65_61_21]PIX00598.1 MAG: 1,4-alpha-glucan branching enzyme [Hydrogenophilales bacterium CG_4_8_14_3_um_filter_62_83]PIY97705.1 MAG: 1,4-alpha-glucan branching enzyme [Hydrogenophilales bacterium CG_4_10_14_0_8_um_filter_62_70]
MSLTLLERILQARHHDPFSFLGLHSEGGAPILRVLRPHAEAVVMLLADGEQPLTLKDKRGLFEWRGKQAPARPIRLRVQEDGKTFEITDPYTFPPMLGEQELYLFNEGRLLEAYRTLGSHVVNHEGVDGVGFAVWAPSAERVSVVGQFNRWDGRSHMMRVRGGSGVWELFIPGMKPGDLYKYEIRNAGSGEIRVKADPYGQCFEPRPGTAAVVPQPSSFEWHDGDWLETRAKADWLHAPFNIYEVHAGSWRRHPDGRYYSYRELADALVPYLQDMNYSHVEFMPLTEHPLDESWGYQTTGYFAATARFGTVDDLKYLVDACHRAGLGVILDWVPGHFPMDDWALARFDGSALYEHADPRLGVHQDWGTHIFNYGRNEVKGFLLASADFWLRELHFDGLRVDAVASMLYLDYSRKAGEWLPNKYGGRENLEAIDFLREMNAMVHERYPGALTFAEESTAWPMVSRPTYVGGLGFSMKWNMGWMNDTLNYISLDPIYRRYHQNSLTFGQLYAYSENFILPFSHDEVVHGKGSLLGKMPGDAWRQFANLRLLSAYQMTNPGKKLNFMGNEFGQGREWNAGWELDWGLLQSHWHEGVQHCQRDLNRLYRHLPQLHELDFNHDGFAWIDCHDADQSVLSYLRRDRQGRAVICAFNFTPIPRDGYRIGCPAGGLWREIFNSDSEWYGGSNAGNGAGLLAEEQPWMGFGHSLVITLPPLAGIILSLD